MQFSISLPRRSHSIRVPLTFLSPMYMSLGHFMLTPSTNADRLFQRARAMHCDSMNCSLAFTNPGWQSSENVRFFPISDSHLFSCCPLPAVCASATTRVIPPMLSPNESISLQKLFVESTLGRFILVNCSIIKVQIYGIFHLYNVIFLLLTPKIRIFAANNTCYD